MMAFDFFSTSSSVMTGFVGGGVAAFSCLAGLKKHNVTKTRNRHIFNVHLFKLLNLLFI